MPLSDEHTKIKEQKQAEFSERLSTLTAARDRMIEAQKADVQKLQGEIDELTVLASGLDSLDHVESLTAQVATLTDQAAKLAPNIAETVTSPEEVKP